MGLCQSAKDARAREAHEVLETTEGALGSSRTGPKGDRLGLRPFCRVMVSDGMVAKNSSVEVLDVAQIMLRSVKKSG